MKIFLVRHAEALHNVTNDVNMLDPILTENGVQQCLTSKALCNPEIQEVDIIISSTAARALQTTLNILKKTKTVYATDLLLEYNTGVLCNKRIGLDLQKTKFPTVDFETYRVEPLSVESTWNDGVNRARKILSLLDKLEKNDITVVIVSHQNILRNLIHEATQHTHYISLANCDYFLLDRYIPATIE